MVIISVPQPFKEMSSPGAQPGPPAAMAAMARKQAVGIVLDWLLVDNVAAVTVETLMTVHCTEKLEYRARLVTAGNTFGPIVEEGLRARMAIVQEFRDADEEIDWRLRGHAPQIFEHVPWLELWARRDELFGALMANETAFPNITRSIRTFAAWRAL